MFEDNRYINVLVYNESFRKGFYDRAYSNDAQISEEPDLDYGEFSSIGYYDGYQYGAYCDTTSQTMGISGEQLIAVISKYFSRAEDKHQDYEKKYIQYKSGFVAGKGDVQLKSFEQDETFNVIPDVDEDDIYSVGYHDGYCIHLNKILNDNSELESVEDAVEQINVPVEIIARKAYKDSFSKYPAFSSKDKQVNK